MVIWMALLEAVRSDLTTADSVISRGVKLLVLITKQV
jgi:hypothetical protein